MINVELWTERLPPISRGVLLTRQVMTGGGMPTTLQVNCTSCFQALAISRPKDAIFAGTIFDSVIVIVLVLSPSPICKCRRNDKVEQ